MADTIKLLNAEAKATVRLVELQAKLAKATGEQAVGIQKNIDSIEKFIAKASSITKITDDVEDLSSQISMSARASDKMGKSLSDTANSVKSLSKVQISIGATGTDEVMKFMDEIAGITHRTMKAQQSMINAADGTIEEQQAAKSALLTMEGALANIINHHEALLSSNTKINNIVQSIAKSTQLTNKELQTTIGLTGEELAAYKELTDEADRMAGRLKGIAAMITTSLKKPMLLFGLAVGGVGEGIGRWGESVKSFGGYIGAAQLQSFALGAVFKDAEETTKSLAEEFGGLAHVSLGTQLNTNLIAANMGISGDEAGKLMGAFTRLNEGSTSMAADLIGSTKELAKQNGLIPAQIMKDLAGSTKAFAEYGKRGGKNISEAAVAAGKLGVSMNEMTAVTDSLLDFETSINNELELGAMLGKNLNLNYARSLAYQGEIGSAVKETLSQLGGIETFQKMDIFQKRKAAELVGVSVEQFEKMAEHSNTLNSKGEIQLKTFERWNESLTYAGTTGLGGMLKLLGTGIIMAGQLGMGFSAIGNTISSTAKGIGGLFKKIFLGGGAGTSIADQMIGKGSETITDKIADKSGKLWSKASPQGKMIETMANKGKDSITEKMTDKGEDAISKRVESTSKFGKINTTSILKGAAAILVLSAALWVSAKAFQEFATVEWESVAKGAAGLLVLGAAAFGLGLLMTTGAGAFVFGAGIIALAALGLAIGVFGAGMSVLGDGMGAITSSLPMMVEQISALSQMDFMPILGLAGALGTLSLALMAVSAAGMLALPILTGIGAVGSMIGLTGTVNAEAGGGSASGMELLNEIKGLRGDLNAGKIAVYIDGIKVTSAVANNVDKSTSNSYSHR